MAQHITEAWWLALAEIVLFHDPRQNYQMKGRQQDIKRVPEHKRLGNQPAHRGLPIGNLSSQFFANVYLNDLDQFIKHQIKARYYIRYVDDFVLLHQSPQWLNAALARINEFLPATLEAQLNPKKTILQPINRGIDFVGQVIKPWHRTTRKRTVNSAIYRVANLPKEQLYESINSYFGLFRQATANHKDRCKLANVARKRGFCVNSEFTKVFRSAA